MYPMHPLRSYYYNDFVTFGIQSLFSNVPQEQIPHILCCIANDVVAKAGSNAARMFVYNKLISNSWYNQEFLNIANDVISILSGRLKPGVDMNHLLDDVVSKYMTCYTSVQVVMNPELKSQLAANVAAAAQDNARQFQDFKEEAIRVNNQQRQMYANQMQQPMAQSMGYAQPIMQPMQQPMPVMTPQGPAMMTPQGLVPVQQFMQPAMQPMQQAFGMQPSMAQPMQPMQQTMARPMPQGGTGQISSKYNKKVPAAYRTEDPVPEPSVFGQPQGTQQAAPMVQAAPAKHYMKRKPGNFGLNVNGLFLPLDEEKVHSRDTSDETFYSKSVIVSNSIKEAMHETRRHQITSQKHGHLGKVYSASFSIVNEHTSTVDLSSLIHESILNSDNLTDIAKAFQHIYEMAKTELLKAVKSSSEHLSNNDVEIYEQYRFIKFIDTLITNRVNEFLFNNITNSINIDSFSEDYPSLFEHLTSRVTAEKMEQLNKFANLFIRELNESFNSEILRMIQQDEVADEDVYITSYLTPVYVANLPINSSCFEMEDEMYVNQDLADIHSLLNDLYKNARSTAAVFDFYVVTLDNAVYRVQYSSLDREYKFNKTCIC